MSPQRNNETSPIESLKRTLDTPTADVSSSFERHGFHEERPEAPTDWAPETAQTTKSTPPMAKFITKKHHTFAKWIFALAVLFFVGALGIAAFFLTGNRNVLSTDKIDIVVTGPTSVSAGEILPLAIEIVNENTAILQTADLLIEYPRGTRSPDDVTTELLRARLSLGDLAPGERLATTSKAIVFGEENTQQEIIVSLEYRVAGSNAIFVKERAFTVEIDDSPVAFSVDAPASVNSGDEVRLEVVVRSNSTAPIENVVIQAHYPFGFSYTSASPEPVFGETVWNIGDIEPEGERTIIVRGTIEGQNDEDRIFKFDLGVEGEQGDISDIGTSFATVEHSIRIARPFVDLALAIGGQRGDTFGILTGGNANLELTWRNNLSNALTDVVLELGIEGSGIDERTITSGVGSYNSSQNSITFDKRTLSSLATLAPGATGRATVTFRALPLSELAGTVVNPDIRLTLTMRGVPVGVRDVPEQIRTSTASVIKVITDATLDTAVYYDSGPFSNSGPVPPRAEQETTYTVVWEASSSVNDISDARVSAKIPPYVSWKGAVSPADADIVYNPSTGSIEWRIGTLRAGDGYKTPARSVAFQLGLTPSVNQIGSTPSLIGEASLSGRDGFTGADVGSTISDRTAEPNESGHSNSSGRVGE